MLAQFAGPVAVAIFWAILVDAKRTIRGKVAKRREKK